MIMKRIEEIKDQSDCISVDSSNENFEDVVCLFDNIDVFVKNEDTEGVNETTEATPHIATNTYEVKAGPSNEALI
ncbi:hypothetical protein TNCT_677521 [Trichonephila clavata]|uniref:Uncharacterized protein n=1 Tax=Trichonephila clavata TaxID=2740835 RepID=A0A8X6LG26_TRICU|nr:hypothetical protein TNCT_677521 [Trichonephila clavata]